jgi:large subunit ribosomal protein L17
MKHRIVGRRLDRTTEHRTAMFRNMVTSLIRHEKIVTTTPKAKELKRIADKAITMAKRATPHARRLANRDIKDLEVMAKLFGPIAERYKTRPGGYTRIIRVGRRAGDNAEMAVIELVDRAPAANADGGATADKAGMETKAEKTKAGKAQVETKTEKAKAEKAKGETKGAKAKTKKAAE